MEKIYVSFRIEAFFKEFLLYILMIVIFVCPLLMAVLEIMDRQSNPGVLSIVITFVIVTGFPFGFFSFNFLKKVFEMFHPSIILSSEGIKFYGKQKISWSMIKNARYSYDNTEMITDMLFLNYETGQSEGFDIDGTNISNSCPTYRKFVLDIILSCINDNHN